MQPCGSSLCSPSWKGQWGGSLGIAPETPELGGCRGLAHPAHTLGAPFSQGNPKPQASWTHNGHALDGQRVSVHTGDKDSILFIRSAQRSDSGRYELTVQLDSMEARAAIDILVIGTGPGRPGASPGAQRPLPPSPRADARETRPGERDGNETSGEGCVAKPDVRLTPDTRVLQRSQGPPAASGSWTSGVAMLPLSGRRPRTQATQSSWATRCRRLTERQG